MDDEAKGERIPQMDSLRKRYLREPETMRDTPLKAMTRFEKQSNQTTAIAYAKGEAVRKSASPSLSGTRASADVIH